MPDFSVHVHVSGTWSVTVTADNEHAAIGKARSIWDGMDNSSPIELDPGDFEVDDWKDAEVMEFTPAPTAQES